MSKKEGKMKFKCVIRRDIPFALIEENKFYEKTIIVEAEDVLDFASKLPKILDEEKITDDYLPLTVTFDELK